MSVWTVSLTLDKCADGKTYTFHRIYNPRVLMDTKQKSAYFVDCSVCSIAYMYAARITIFTATEVGECL